MVDAIIILVVVVLLIFALKGSIKHFRGEGACCGGPVVGRRMIRISGMHCQNCVNSVTNALNAIDGVSAEVSLKDNCAEVSCDRKVDDIDLKQAVERAGFEVLGISQV